MKSLLIDDRYTHFKPGSFQLAAVLICSVLSLLLIQPAPYGYCGPPPADASGVDGKINSGPALAESEQPPGWAYNSEYIYAVSRAVRDSDLHAAGKVPLFIPSIVIDTALLPVALLAGLLG